MRRSSEELRTGVELGHRLRRRHEEIEQEILTCVFGLSDLPDTESLEYAQGLRAAVVVGIEYAIACIERKKGGVLPVPGELLAQARLAARSRVGLDTVLRRYVAGQTLLSDFIVNEAEGPLP
jgi:hypothetical protein